MSWFLQALGLLKRHYTDDDVLNAENENDLYDHSQALAEVQRTCGQRVVINTKLRIALRASQVRSHQSAELERCIKQETERVRTSAS